jgi:hypothetical protein
MLIDFIVETVKEYILNGVLKENPIIKRISSMNHSQMSVSVNLGAWWQKGHHSRNYSKSY